MSSPVVIQQSVGCAIGEVLTTQPMALAPFRVSQPVSGICCLDPSLSIDTFSAI